MDKYKFRYVGLFKSLVFWLRYCCRDKFCCLLSGIFILGLSGSLVTAGFSQDSDVEITFDANANTITLPKIFKSYVDLSGRGVIDTAGWPKGLSASESLDTWQKDIGFNGFYRVQYDLWEINESVKDNKSYAQLLDNYEAVIKKISDAGGVVILNIFGTPAGMGKVLDKKSPSVDPVAFKNFIKSHIKELSCNKKYNIWYEVWSAPDLDDFFLGKKEEYFAMYRAVAEGIKELEAEFKIHIPVGGPGVTWWFQNCDGNNVLTPEKSLIYELIKYCGNYHIPLDFISWHAYSTDPKAEREATRYNKSPAALVREWLSYFHFNRNIPLIIDEWNYDSGANYLSARQENANIGASFIPARLKNMYESGLDYQIYFSLEDFYSSKDRLVRNTGVFRFNPYSKADYQQWPKSIYSVFRMLSQLGSSMYVLSEKTPDEFVGAIATKQDEYIAVILYNYIDPALAKNYLSRNIAVLNDAEVKILLKIIKSDGLEKIIGRKTDVSAVRATKRLKTMLKNAQELNILASIYKASDRTVRFSVKNIKEKEVYQKYVVGPSCSAVCELKPVEEKELNGANVYSETLKLPPYSVYLLIFKKKPKEVQPEVVPAPVAAPPEPVVIEGNKGNIVNNKPKETEVVSPQTTALSPAANETTDNKGNVVSKSPKEAEAVVTVEPNNKHKEAGAISQDNVKKETEEPAPIVQEQSPVSLSPADTEKKKN